MAHLVKNLPAIQETWVQSLGKEDLLENRMATHSSILAWRIPWMEKSSDGSLQIPASKQQGKVRGGQDLVGASIRFWTVLSLLKKNYLFLYLFWDCAGSLLMHICGLSLAAVSRGYPLLRCVGF